MTARAGFRQPAAAPSRRSVRIQPAADAAGGSDRAASRSISSAAEMPQAPLDRRPRGIIGAHQITQDLERAALSVGIAELQLHLCE